ncbi:1,4-alpha-glucan branching enzyme, putative, partial [Eimeria tenella]
VEVAGSKFPMEREAGDQWSVCLSGVRGAAAYHFVFSSNCNDCFHQEGHLLHRRDPYARFCDFNSNDCFVVLPPAAAAAAVAAAAGKEAAAAAAAAAAPPALEPWNKWIIYELHPSTFVQPKEGQTVFEAIGEKLDYIASLVGLRASKVKGGFNAVELMPVQEFGGLWGYNPRLLMALHSPYGNPEGLRALVECCHRRRIAVIFDVVLNHGSSKLNSLWNWDGYGPHNNGGIYFEGGGESGWGRKFAFHKPQVRNMIKKAAAVFLEEYK